LRVIKQNTVSYESFHKSVPFLTKVKVSGGAGRNVNLVPEPAENNKYTVILKSTFDFEKNIRKSKTNQQVFTLFEEFLKGIIGIKEANIFFPNYEERVLSSIFPNSSERLLFFINNSFSTGILKSIIENGNSKIIPDALVYDIDGSRSSYLLIPLQDENTEINGYSKNGGILCASLQNSEYSEGSFEISIIQLSLQIVLSQVDILSKQKELKNTIDELQAYQSKLANDFKLYALGELTSGIVEEVLSPLQVITSTIELLRTDDIQIDGKILDTINSQVKKVKSIINNLLKFAGNNESKFKVQPCNINELINEFYEMTVSSLNNDKYECILDLEESLPPVITQPNYIYQLLTNIFSVIKSEKNGEGGVLIQTKYRDENVEIRFLTTDFMQNLKQANQKIIKDVNLRIINNIMAKHEGELFFDSDGTRGTVIALSFPIKRKIGK
jgi:hypothetical protein